MGAPLEGIRVLDLTHVLAGPYTTYQLALLGAEVIKVERPGVGDVMRRSPIAPELDGMAPGFVSMNAGKKSLALDLAHPEGPPLIARLAASADVLVENFRPGVMERLGLGAAALRRSNPRLIYCSISGFGQDGPVASRAAFDHVVQAATGMMLLSGARDEDPPMKVGFPVVDIGAGMHAAVMILGALLERSRTGEGCRLDVSMSNAALLLMVGMVSGVLIAGLEPRRVGNRGFAGSPGADTYATADGALAVGANTRAQFETFCRVIGRPDLPTDPRFVAPAAPGAASSFMPARNLDELRAELARALALRPAVEWEERLNAEGIPAARVRSLGDFLRGLYRQTTPISATVGPVPGYDRTLEVLAPRLSAGAPALSPPPRLGQDTREVLAALGLTAAEIDALVAARVVACADA